MVIGDFNLVVPSDENIGGCIINLNDAFEFFDMIQHTILIDVGFCGSKYHGQTIDSEVQP